MSFQRFSLHHTFLDGLRSSLDITMDGRRRHPQKSRKSSLLFMPYLATIVITLLLAVPAMSVELFRYRGAAKDGGTLEYVFEAGEQNSPDAVTKEKAAEIAADFMTTFYHVQIGALETQEFRTTPVPFWLISFSDARLKDQLKICISSSCYRTGRLLCQEWRKAFNRWSVMRTASTSQ